MGRLHVVEGTMNSEKYTTMLQHRLLPQLHDWFPSHQGGNIDNEFIYMQDSAPCHVSKLSMKCLEDNGIPVLSWPGNSPDLNPIETLWAIVKQRLRGQTIKIKAELIRALLDIWFHDEKMAETCEKLVASMPDRCKAVIAAKGGHTKY